MKIWSVFSLVILFHFAIIALLFIQPGCQSQAPTEPDPATTSVPQSPQYSEPQPVAELDPAFNAGVPQSSTTTPQRQLSAPTRPATTQRAESDMGLLQPVDEPVTDSFSLPPVTRKVTVQKGDTLTAIAKREGVSLNNLLSANGLGRNSTIYVGQSMLVPQSQAVENEAALETEHSGKEVTVKKGDTLSAIANRHGSSVRILKALNNLTRDTIFVGQTLVVPASSSEPARSFSEPVMPSQTTASPSGLVTYTVKAGDTPSGIARQYGITSRELMAANNITDPRRLYIGRSLVIPSAGSTPVQSFHGPRPRAGGQP